MPELPEVTTTVNKLRRVLIGQRIVSAWTNYNSAYHAGKTNIKNPKYFALFRRAVVGRKIVGVRRLGKNVLIDIGDVSIDVSAPKTILIHMKMTGHLLYGRYKKVGKKVGKKVESRNGGGSGSGRSVEWVALEKGPLQDKFNGYIRLVFELSNGKMLVLSDVRRFAKVCLIEDGVAENYADLAALGPDPLARNFDWRKFKAAILKRPTGRIKNVLMDQMLIAGIGNIYSDEALWLSGIHPETSPKKLSDVEIRALLKNIKKVLRLGIDFGGDSTSDYRQPDGRPGRFQHQHNVYRRRGEKCRRRGCSGSIARKVVGGRSAHYCDTHQKI